MSEDEERKGILRVASGKSKGTELEVDRRGTYSVGRGDDMDLQVRGKGVSREHCELQYDGDHFWLIDVDSVNGTYVNNQRVRRYMLYDGDQVRLARTLLLFSVEDEEE
ncbi:MAG: FHA domain-containing protein [Candidatus Brocadiia bacterium]